VRYFGDYDKIFAEFRELIQSPVTDDQARVRLPSNANLFPTALSGKDPNRNKEAPAIQVNSMDVKRQTKSDDEGDDVEAKRERRSKHKSSKSKSHEKSEQKEEEKPVDKDKDKEDDVKMRSRSKSQERISFDAHMASIFQERYLCIAIVKWRSIFEPFLISPVTKDMAPCREAHYAIPRHHPRSAGTPNGLEEVYLGVPSSPNGIHDI